MCALFKLFLFSLFPSLVLLVFSLWFLSSLSSGLFLCLGVA